MAIKKHLVVTLSELSTFLESGDFEPAMEMRTTDDGGLVISPVTQKFSISLEDLNDAVNEFQEFFAGNPVVANAPIEAGKKNEELMHNVIYGAEAEKLAGIEPVVEVTQGIVTTTSLTESTFENSLFKINDKTE